MSRNVSKWQIVEGNLATPAGFRAGAVAAGIKKKRDALDLALIVSDSPSTATAGVFTKNRVAAAPVQLSRKHLQESRGRCRAVIVNAGNANACTGKAGMQVAEETARATAALLGLETSQVLVASTGVIGVALNLDLIVNQLPALRDSLEHLGAPQVTYAIMTTDTFPKSCVVRGEFKGTTVHIAGVAKGAGMIHPNMATMLSFITTDASVRARMLHNLLAAAAKESFNRITVDGDTSTNDTLIAMASGASDVAVIPGNETRAWFSEGLTLLCQTLARMIARDGEGATKLIQVEVMGARTPLDADRVARAIANSPLVKTAFAGADPNWGRIICAAGYSGAKFDPNKIDITVNNLTLCRKGMDAGYDEAAAHKEFGEKEIVLRVDLHAGRASAQIWTCDMTHGYIEINSSYRS